MNNIKDKRLLICGTGAVGGYYGGMLVKAGLRNPTFDVTFIARGENYKALKQDGLTLIREGKKEIIPINVVAIHELPLQEKFDYIFICVKSIDTKEAVKHIIPNVSEKTTVVSFQNGIENEEIIAAKVGQEHVIGANVYVTSRLTSPGVIDQFGYNAVVIGEFSKIKTKRILELKTILDTAGILCNISEDISADLWNKLVWNASFNPVSVITQKTVDKMMADPGILELLKNIMEEVKRTAIAHGINIRTDTVEFNLNRSKGIIRINAAESQDFTGFKTSMLQDFERGKPLELEELVGVVVRKAKEKNVSVTNIERVYNQIKQKITTGHVIARSVSNEAISKTL